MTDYDVLDAPVRGSQIRLHGPEGFEYMRKAGRLTAECLDMLVGEVKPGGTTAHINGLVQQFALDHHAIPSTLMYRGYRHATCTSINHVVCHGIPNEKPL